MKSGTGSFEGLQPYNDKWFPSAIKYVSGKKSVYYGCIICLTLYNCITFYQCISIYEEDINNLKKYFFLHKNYY